MTAAKTIYVDNAATTPLSPTALKAMLPYLTEEYGNPSSVYAPGRRAREAIEKARAEIGAAIHAQAEEIYFTGGGTEADNWAIKGVAELKKNKGRHIISSSIEHHAVLYSLKSLERQGYEVTYLPVDNLGRINPASVAEAMREDTILITIMAANNEIGTIMPIAEIGAMARKHGVLFHTDAVQAVGHIPIDVQEMNIDFLSLAGHKFGGPKGVGALYIKKGLRLPSYLNGGEQERGRRAGTENVAGIVGMAAALTESVANMDANRQKVTALRDELIDGLLKVPASRLTGDRGNRLPGIASFVFAGIEGESMILLLDQNGICASSGSACSSGSLDPSHVLLAIGLPHEVAHGSLRLSLSENNTKEEIDYILAKLPEIVGHLRDMSPLWEG